MISERVLTQYQRDVDDYLAGRIGEDRFPGIRLLQGIYAQRQEDQHMVRTKIPGGVLTPEKLEALARVLERYSRDGHDVVHLTTRQDVQFHYVDIAATPRMLRDLARHGITTREASGNTVRNVTACPLAGVCPREHVDVRTHVEATARHFLGHPLTQQLPRKFKISFSGCAADCAQGLIHDLAAIATRDASGAPGFRLLAFGGLGAKPHEALVLDPFVPEPDLLPAIEAVLALHHRYSDRKRRSQARLKFLVGRFGAERLGELYREELQRARAGFADAGPRGSWREPGDGEAPRGGVVRRVTPQHQSGRVAVPVAVRLGRLRARQLRGLAALLRELGLDEIRATQDQNLLIPHVPEARLAELRGRLAALELGEPRAGDNVVSCPGTHLCPLAITGSPYLAAELDGGTADLRLRVNGCQNSCAQSDSGDVGLYGKAKRHHGHLLPSYTLQLGGNGVESGGLGFEGPTVPAQRAPEAVRRIARAYAEERQPGEDFRAWSRHKGAPWFEELLGDLSEVQEHEADHLQRDLGAGARFRVQTVGLGECAGAGFDVLALAEAELAYQRNSRYAFALESEWAEGALCLTTIAESAARGVLTDAGASAPQDRGELAAALAKALPHGSPLAPALTNLLEEIQAEPRGDAHAGLAARVETWAAELLALARLRRRAVAPAPVPEPRRAAAAGR